MVWLAGYAAAQRDALLVLGGRPAVAKLPPPLPAGALWLDDWLAGIESQ